MRRVSLLFALAGAAAVWAAPAGACTIGATGVAFGSYDPRSATAKDSTGTVTLNCPSNRSGVVSMSTGGSASYTQRKMASGANTLNYNLYTNSTRTAVWGDGTGGSTTVSVAKGYAGTLTIYGRIPASQNVRAGTYSDTITVTVTF